MIKDLIEVKQLPVIEEQLKNVSTIIDERVKNATSLVCTEETVKTIKELRAELNKDYREFETQRKAVKEQVLKPYEDFENIYKRYISDKFRNADLILKGKIDVVENELKAKKEKEIKDYFEEYKIANEIDFITYEQAKINVTLTASMKSLKEQAKTFIDRVNSDLATIALQEHKDEILVEYKQNGLILNKAMETVLTRTKAVEEEKKKQEEIINNNLKEEQKRMTVALDNLKNNNKEDITLQAPTEEKQEEILTLKFTVRGTRTKLKELKQFLIDGGYDYE